MFRGNSAYQEIPGLLISDAKVCPLDLFQLRLDVCAAGLNRTGMSAKATKLNRLEKQYFKQAEKLKRKLMRGRSWNSLQKERDAMTRLAIAICENHHKSHTCEKLLFGEIHV